MLVLPVIDINDSNDIYKLLCQNVGSLKIEWTYGWSRQSDPNQILWWGLNNALSDESSLRKRDGNPVDSIEIGQISSAINENEGLTYNVWWDAYNSQYWPYALKFTFTLYDSKGIIKNGRTFTHIVYIGN